MIKSTWRQRPAINDDRSGVAFIYFAESVPLAFQVLPTAAR